MARNARESFLGAIYAKDPTTGATDWWTPLVVTAKSQSREAGMAIGYLRYMQIFSRGVSTYVNLPPDKSHPTQKTHIESGRTIRTYVRAQTTNQHSKQLLTP